MESKAIRNRMTDRVMRRPGMRKAFDAAWYIHARMFGEIMDPAFINDTAARLDLLSILDLMTGNEYYKAMKKLNRLYKFCDTDEDFAAWFFFMGLCRLKLGQLDKASVLLTQSAKYEPDFYMVYLMLARCLHESRFYEPALSAYAHTLDKVLNAPRRDELHAVRREPLLGSLHGNMATCCVMMRLYDEAEYELIEAESFGYDPPMMNLTRAMLYAATDRKAQARERMALLRDKLPEAESRAVLTVEEIISGKNPHFCLQKIDVPRLRGFWDWFCEHELFFRTAARSGFSAFACNELKIKLREVFGYKDETVSFLLDRDGEKIRLGFFDNYSLTNEIWLGKLIDMTPQELKKQWSFYAEH